MWGVVYHFLNGNISVIRIFEEEPILIINKQEVDETCACEEDEEFSEHGYWQKVL